MHIIVSVYLFVLLNIHKNPVSYKVTATRDKILYGYSFRNITGITAMNQCLAKCLEDCKCLSFQICEQDKMCQLCSKHRAQSEEFFRQGKGCTSFVFEREQSLQIGTSGQKSCFEDTNCCLTSQPCQNGALCVPSTLHGIRFTCKCRPGYKGIYCELPIRSCHGYEEKKKGYYYVIDTNGNAFMVYCQYSSTKKFSYTLIQSFLPAQRNDLEHDHEVNEDNPKQIPYRMSFSRMASIRQNARMWCITHIYAGETKCQHDTFVGIDVRQQKCTSCVTFKFINDEIVKNGGDQCQLFDRGSNECNDSHVDNYGSYCCYNSTIYECPPNSDLLTGVWLQET